MSRPRRPRFSWLGFAILHGLWVAAVILAAIEVLEIGG